MRDPIDRHAAILAIKTRQWLIEGAKEALADQLERLPSAQPDKEKISDALYNIYRNKGTNTSAEGVAAIKYYIAEIWREIFGEEGPKWMT